MPQKQKPAAELSTAGQLSEQFGITYSIRKERGLPDFGNHWPGRSRRRCLAARCRPGWCSQATFRSATTLKECRKLLVQCGGIVIPAYSQCYFKRPLYVAACVILRREAVGKSYILARLA